MGRTQTFDTDEAVRSARDVFWDKGFEGTSLADLEVATGLSRSSLYHAFTSKRGLFDAAVQDYLDTIIRPRLRILITEPIPADAVQQYFNGLIQAINTLTIVTCASSVSVSSSCRASWPVGTVSSA